MARVKLDNYVLPEAPRLGFRGWMRWIWRQVTSMRVALILLLLLAMGAIPGSVLPQAPREPVKAREFVEANGWWGQFLEKAGFLDVYGSAWFTAIYVLLFASLIGCIIPRCIAHYREMRAPVTKAPSRLDRYQPQAHGEASGEPGEAVGQVAKALRPNPGFWGTFTGYRVRIDDRVTKGERQVALAAEKGHIRELGNLVFHVSLIGILICVGFGAAFTYRGQAIIVEGRSFTNSVVAYDTFSSGRLFNEDSLEPFTLTLDEFHSQFSLAGRPESFAADVTLTEPGREPTQHTIKVNSPLGVDGANIYLQGNGYAPDLTFTDSDGNVAYSGPVVFIPQDGFYTSTGVVKAPDVTSGEQVGIKATLYPTAVGEGTDFLSLHPDLTNPVIVFTAYTGDLGLDDGVPQNVYKLDESRLSPVRGEDGQQAVMVIKPGETVELPDGSGSLTWNDTYRYAAFDIRADPSLPFLLFFAVTALLGLALSLFGARRRIWVIATAGAGDAPVTLVHGAALAPPHDLAKAKAELARAMAAAGRREEE
ncbi:cytochrome c biogenesis protein ResB [Demequina sp.]|uniref:cytochrome c biogenesis protein ResB n=1 Tax=Demequina sp. TaxID=2050685 RepID=UPI003D1127FA